MAPRVHGNNKCRLDLGIDATHKVVQDVTLQLLLARWRGQQLPAGSIMALYCLYSRDMDVTSAFLNWWSMWRLFRGQSRLAMLKGVSLVAPDFVEDMLRTWYRTTECFSCSLDDLD